MEDVLYDMHVAQSVYEAREGGIDNGANLVALRASVLKNHGIAQAEWDSSYNYYCRNARELYRIYQRLSTRIDNNVVALGGKVAGMQGEEADTANVWNAEPSFLLMQQPPYNLYTFEITPDSTFEDGDRITLQYDAQFIFQDGSRDLAAYVAVYYDNDSVTAATARTYFDGHGVVTINNDVDRLHIKMIRGYFILMKNLTQRTDKENSSPLRLVTLNHVKLLHLHTAPPAKKEPEPEKTDTLKTDSLIRDSVQNLTPVIVNRK